MKRLSAFLYSMICYVIFFGAFLYMILFLGDLYVPKTINSGASGDLLSAVLINLGLITLFGIQHTVMARKSFKKNWTRIVAKPVERSTYVLLSSLTLIVLLAFWQPMPSTIWEIKSGWGSMLLEWGFWLGWLIVFLSTWMIDHFNLFGLKQTWNYLQQRNPNPPGFREPGLYKYVRHPLMLGFLIAFWSRPEMSAGHLVFSIGMTLYILVGVYFEEKSMIQRFGNEYREYRDRVPKFFPGIKQADT